MTVFYVVMLAVGLPVLALILLLERQKWRMVDECIELEERIKVLRREIADLRSLRQRKLIEHCAGLAVRREVLRQMSNG